MNLALMLKQGIFRINLLPLYKYLLLLSPLLFSLSILLNTSLLYKSEAEYLLKFANVAVSSSFHSLDQFYSSNITILSICHPAWIGIKAASYAQGNPVLEVPGILSSAHFHRLLDLILTSNIKTIIVNGIPDGFVELAYALRRNSVGIRIIFIYHGSFSQDFHKEEAGLLDKVIMAAKNGVVSRIGVVKNGIVSTIRSFGVDAHEIWNFPPLLTSSKSKSFYNGDIVDGEGISDSIWKIGIFGSKENHKNVITQIAAACSIPNAILYVRRNPRNIPYLKHCKALIVDTGDLSHDKFMKLLATMHITLYVSLTEAFPMLVIESMSLGVPCITSSTSAVFDLDKTLGTHLTVNELDAPDIIADRVKYVIANYAEISKRCIDLVPRIRMKAHELWSNFLHFD